MSNWNERMLGGAPSHSDGYNALGAHQSNYQSTDNALGAHQSNYQSNRRPFNRSAKIKCGLVTLIILIVIVIVVPIMLVGKHEDQPANPFPTPVNIYLSAFDNPPVNGQNDQSILVLPDEHGIRPELTEAVQFYSALGYNVYLIDYFFGGSIDRSGGMSREQFLQKYPLQQSADYARQAIVELNRLSYQSIQVIGYGYGANVALSMKHPNQTDPINQLVDSLIVNYPWVLDSIDQSINQSVGQLMDPLLKPTFFVVPALSSFAQNVTTYEIIFTANQVNFQTIVYANQMDGFAIDQSDINSGQTNKTQSHADTFEWLLAHGRVNNVSLNLPLQRGVKSVINNVPVYVTEPFRQSPIQSPPITMLYLPDIYGDRFESRRLVDFYANIGYRTILIDYSLTDVNLAINQSYSVANFLHNDGTTNMITLGFCYGGKVAVTLAENASIVIGAGTAHPSRLVSSDAPWITQPMYFSMSSGDAWTTAQDGWPTYDAVLSAATIPHHGMIFEQRHGWTQNSPTTIKQLTDKFVALTAMIQWLSLHVKTV